jgi:hypothetical protein
MNKFKGRLYGFLFGSLGCLLLFRHVIFENAQPNDDVPWYVFVVSLLSGWVFYLIGGEIAKKLEK